MYAAGRQPVAQLVVVRAMTGNTIAILKALPSLRNCSTTGFSASALIGCTGLPSAPLGDVGQHLRPDRVRHGDRVAIQVHAEGGDHIGLGAEADGRAQRLTGQHVRAVEFAADHAVEEHLPVRLRFERDVQALVLEVAFLIGNGQRRHVGELDEAELDLLLLELQRLRQRRRGRQQHGRHDHRYARHPTALDHFRLSKKKAADIRCQSWGGGWTVTTVGGVAVGPLLDLTNRPCESADWDIATVVPAQTSAGSRR